MNSFSIYIPRLNSNVTEDYIKYVFRSTNIGEVARVDFTPIGKNPGFIENLADPFKSAFVHFSFFTNISQADPDFGNKVRQGNGYKFYPGTVQEGYWLLLPAKNPIQHTMMNNSQIVENCRYLENKVEQQEAKLAEQAETIQELQKKIDGVHNVVYQLLGGLFNQGSQSQALQDHLSILYSEPSVRSRFEDPEEDDSEWESWPTTRQGDENEERIQCLYKKFNDLIATVNNHAEKGSAMELRVYSLEEQIHETTNFEPEFTPYEEQEDADEEQDTELQARKFVPTPYPMQQINDELTVSTHSSMPDLVEASESDNDSVPELESVSSVDSKERLRNSYELCGNE